MPKPRALCKNCGQPTTFGARAQLERVKRGWCGECFVQSQRTFDDPETGEKRYYDDLRTIDGIKSRFSPK
jgi:hypothetical protein